MSAGTEATAPESGFMLEGRVYEVPSLDSFSLDESIVLYDYSKLTMQDFAPPGEDDDPEEYEAAREEKMAHPGFLKALLHIAYQRGNPDAKPAKVKAVVGQANFVEAVEPMLDEEEEGEEGSPPDPESTSELGPSSPRSSGDSSGSSGMPSPTDSDSPDAALVPSTGTTR